MYAKCLKIFLVISVCFLFLGAYPTTFINCLNGTWECVIDSVSVGGIKIPIKTQKLVKLTFNTQTYPMSVEVATQEGPFVLSAVQPLNFNGTAARLVYGVPWRPLVGWFEIVTQGDYLTLYSYFMTPQTFKRVKDQ